MRRAVTVPAVNDSKTEFRLVPFGKALDPPVATVRRAVTVPDVNGPKTEFRRVPLGGVHDPSLEAKRRELAWVQAALAASEEEWSGVYRTER